MVWNYEWQDKDTIRQLTIAKEGGGSAKIPIDTTSKKF